MLKQRIITGLIMAVVFIGSIVYGGPHWVGLFFAAVLFQATREMLALTLRLPDVALIVAAAVFALLFWWSLSWIQPLLIFWQALAGVVLWLLITLSFFFYRHHGNWPLSVRVLMLALGLDLLWICVHGLNYLHAEYGWPMLLYLFSLVWIADIGAYFSGRRFGRHKLAPGISPGKTWEGVIGGVCANVLWILLIYSIYTDQPLSLPAFILVSLVAVAISIVGDLMESILKREAGVKDSGKLLPGHGGVLDRIDSVIAAAPVFAAGLLTAAA